MGIQTTVEAYVVGLRIRQMRLERGWKQEEMARRIGVDRTSLSSYEHGKRTPDIYMLCRIADEYDVTLDYLVGREYPKNENEKFLLKSCKSGNPMVI